MGTAVREGGQHRPSSPTSIGCGELELDDLRQLANRFPPNGPNRVGGIHQLVTYFQTLGMDATEAREGLMSMLGFVYGTR